jgi:hypothetical protein
MLTRSKIAGSNNTGATVVLTAAIILGAVSAAAARDDGPPTVDIQKTCRESSNVLSLAGSDNQDFEACMSDEQAAREQLVKGWANYPAAARAQCIKPKEYLPDYVEWQSCLDMTREVMTMRQGGGRSAPAPASGQSPGH